MSDTADIMEIRELLPHRYPFLLVDKLRDIVPGKSATGIKNVTINEPFFPGHFPARPVMPGVLMIEALAQTASVLVFRSLGLKADDLVFFMAIENAKFRQPVGPGDVLELKVEVIRGRGKVWKFQGHCEVEGKLVAEAQFTAMMAPEDAK